MALYRRRALSTDDDGRSDFFDVGLARFRAFRDFEERSASPALEFDEAAEAGFDASDALSRCRLRADDARDDAAYQRTNFTRRRYSFWRSVTASGP